MAVSKADRDRIGDHGIGKSPANQPAQTLRNLGIEWRGDRFEGQDRFDRNPLILNNRSQLAHPRLDPFSRKDSGVDQGRGNWRDDIDLVAAFKHGHGDCILKESFGTRIGVQKQPEIRIVDGLTKPLVASRLGRTEKWRERLKVLLDRSGHFQRWSIADEPIQRPDESIHRRVRPGYRRVPGRTGRSQSQPGRRLLDGGESDGQNTTIRLHEIASALVEEVLGAPQQLRMA